MHKIQNNILGFLLFKQKARFSEINKNNISNDHFTFHLKKLLDKKLIEKNKGGFYALTSIGKEYANRLDVDSGEIKIERQAKIGVLIICLDSSSKEKKYLIQQRLKQPYYGFYGFISGKMKWGEKVYESAERELGEEAGLKAKLELVGIEHKMDYSQEGDLLEDKYFYIIKAVNFTGKLTENFEGGKNIWLTKKEIKKLPNLFDDVLKVIKVVDNNKFVFLEDKYIISQY